VCVGERDAVSGCSAAPKFDIKRGQQEGGQAAAQDACGSRGVSQLEWGMRKY
jgi:hypothetical protein